MKIRIILFLYLSHDLLIRWITQAGCGLSHRFHPSTPVRRNISGRVIWAAAPPTFDFGSMDQNEYRPLLYFFFFTRCQYVVQPLREKAVLHTGRNLPRLDSPSLPIYLWASPPAFWCSGDIRIFPRLCTKAWWPQWHTTLSSYCESDWPTRAEGKTKLVLRSGRRGRFCSETKAWGSSGGYPACPGLTYRMSSYLLKVVQPAGRRGDPQHSTPLKLPWPSGRFEATLPDFLTKRAPEGLGC